MSINGMKVVGVSRMENRPVLEQTVYSVLRHRELFDAYQLWAVSPDPELLQYAHGLTREHPSLFHLIQSPQPSRQFKGPLAPFWQLVREPDTVYLRLDDVVWIQEGAIAALLQYRLEQARPFLVLGNVVNSSLCTYLHQRAGVLSLAAGRATYSSRCPTAWANGAFGVRVHEAFLASLAAGTTEDWKFSRWILWAYEPSELNVAAWFGRDITPSSLTGLATQEEHWATAQMPKVTGRPNEICGSALFVRWASKPQQDRVKAAGVLSRYGNL